MQMILDKAILASRHILVVFYLGLALALALYALHFAWKLVKYASGLFSVEDSDYLLGLLYLLDSALVASLVVTVAVSSYDSMVSRLTDGAKAQRIDWVAEVDPGNLKIKLTTAIIAISSIHLLQIFLKSEKYSDRSITWALVIHAAFLVGGLCLAVMDKLEGTTKAARKAVAKKVTEG